MPSIEITRRRLALRKAERRLAEITAATIGLAADMEGLGESLVAGSVRSSLAPLSRASRHVRSRMVDTGADR